MGLGFAAAGVGVFMWLLTMVSYWISIGLNITVPFVMPVLLTLFVVDVICAVAAAVTGFRARRLDPSSAGTLALVLGCLAGAFWALAVILEIAGAVFGWE